MHAHGVDYAPDLRCGHLTCWPVPRCAARRASSWCAQAMLRFVWVGAVFAVAALLPAHVRAPSRPFTCAMGDKLTLFACPPLSPGGTACLPTVGAQALGPSSPSVLFHTCHSPFRCTAATRTPTARLAGAKAAPLFLQADAAPSSLTAHWLPLGWEPWGGTTTSAPTETANAGPAGQRGARGSIRSASKTPNAVR